MLRSVSAWSQRACRISRKRAPVRISERIAATGNGPRTTRRFSSLARCFDAPSVSHGSPSVSASRSGIAEPGELLRREIALVRLLAVFADSARRVAVAFRHMFMTLGAPVEARHRREHAVCLAGRCGHLPVHRRHAGRGKGLGLEHAEASPHTRQRAVIPGGRTRFQFSSDVIREEGVDKPREGERRPLARLLAVRVSA